MRHKLAFLALAMGLAIGSAARADVIAHNGSADSDPAPADSTRGMFMAEEVDVDLYAEPDFSFVDKFYNELGTLQLEYEFESGQPPVASLETVFNDTLDLWTSFVITLEFARFTPSDEDAILPEGDLNVGVDIQASANVASIVHTSSGTGAEFELTFTDGGLASGDFFDLRYYISRLAGAPVVPLAGFYMEETPHTFIIPAPGAAVLAVVGLGCVGWVKRRSQ